MSQENVEVVRQPYLWLPIAPALRRARGLALPRRFAFGGA
jgi:hypothetical protein